MTTKRIITANSSATFKVGEHLAHQLRGDETIALVGALGTGKTVFAQGIAVGLGIKGRVASPTFVIEKVYRVPGQPWRLHHADLYRVRGDIRETGLTEAVGNNVVLVEWADYAPTALPEDVIKITIKELDHNHREIVAHVPDNRTYILNGLSQK